MAVHRMLNHFLIWSSPRFRVPVTQLESLRNHCALRSVLVQYRAETEYTGRSVIRGFEMVAPTK